MSTQRLGEWVAIDLDDVQACKDDYEGEVHYFLEFWPATDRQREFVPGGPSVELLEAMERDSDLCEHFDEYIDDMRQVFGVPSWRSGRPLAADVLARHPDEIVRACSAWVLPGLEPNQFFRQELESLLALLRCYRFDLAPDREAGAALNFGYYLGWLAAQYAYEVGRYDE